MLTVENAYVSYGKSIAVRDASLTVNRGEIVTLIGANGAGKTSLMNAITGVVPLQRGEIRLEDNRLTGLPSHETVKLGLGYVPEGRQIFGTMTVEDNLILGAYIECAKTRLGSIGPIGWFLRKNEFRSRIETVYRLFPRLKERVNQKAGSLSGGEQQMLAIGRTLMSSPRIILLDEPSLGLAPNLVREILRLLVRLREEEGLTVLLVEQDANAALKIADRGYVMERGRIIIEGTAKELMGNDQVRQAYLGKAIA